MGAALRQGRPRRQDGARHDQVAGRGGARGRRADGRRSRSDAEVRADRRGRQPPRGADAPRLAARRRRGHRAARRSRSWSRSTRPASDEVVTQWDKDVVEELGLLKMDFLGLRTLTVIDDTLQAAATCRASSSTSTRCRSTTPRSTGCSATGAPTASSSSSRRGMKDLLRRAAAVALRGPRGLQRPLPAGRALGRHGRGVHPAQARRARRCATSCPRPSRSWRRPTASSPTRSR